MSSAAGTVAGNDPMVSVDWLHSNLNKPGVKVLDASWYMPQMRRNPVQEYQAAHIPGAHFFDVDGIIDRNSNLPHMLPSAVAFSAAISAIGISNDDMVIVYDGKGMFSAPRAWWMFRVFGHDKVRVLDGGLPQWRASGFDVESCELVDDISKENKAVEKVYQGLSTGPLTFQAKLNSDLVWTLEQIQKNMQNQNFQHVDARSKARFDGLAPEPREGIQSGHIPGSKCVPFNEMVDGSQMLLPANELIKRFETEDISLDCPIIASCGTGVTACIVVLGLYRLGKSDVPLYDGSWTEWALEHGLTT